MLANNRAPLHGLCFQCRLAFGEIQSADRITMVPILITSPSLVPDSPRRVNTFCVHFQLTSCFFAGTVWDMPKPKKEQITIRVLPETRRAIEQLSQDNLITLGDALDLLVKSSPKRPRPQKEPRP